MVELEGPEIGIILQNYTDKSFVFPEKKFNQHNSYKNCDRTNFRKKIRVLSFEFNLNH